MNRPRALDIAHQVDVLALIQRLSHERGLTVIAVLHDLNMAARYCDRLVALHAGEVTAEGGPEAIMQAEVLGDIYGIPMGILPHLHTGSLPPAMNAGDNVPQERQAVLRWRRAGIMILALCSLAGIAFGSDAHGWTWVSSDMLQQLLPWRVPRVLVVGTILGSPEC